MIDSEKIDLLVKEGEGLHVEFKEHFISRIDEDMVACSNTKEYLRPALEAELIARTIPEKPNSRLQQYRLTDKGRTLLTGLNGSKSS